MSAQHAPRVLIIDDEPDVSVYLTTILSQHGYEVETASSSEAAWAYLSQSTPQLVCLDVMMPRESGFSLYTRMKADARLRSIPVLIISGVAQAKDFDFREYVSDKAIPPPAGYFEKPIDVALFIETITSLAAELSARTGDVHA